MKKQEKKVDDGWKNVSKLLFKAPRGQDYLVLFILICVFFLAWAYKHDMNACGEVLQACEDRCYPNLINPQSSKWLAEEIDFDFDIPVNGSNNLSMDT